MLLQKHEKPHAIIHIFLAVVTLATRTDAATTISTHLILNLILQTGTYKNQEILAGTEMSVFNVRSICDKKLAFQCAVAGAFPVLQMLLDFDTCVFQILT